MWRFSCGDDEVDSVKREIFNKYAPALVHIGVDFDREDVQQALIDCYAGLEPSLQAFIAYWVWRQSKNERIEYPSAALVDALAKPWPPIGWRDEFLDNPNFKSLCQLWWEEAAVVLGKDLRDSLVADVRELDNGTEYIEFRSGRVISLRAAKVRGWNNILEYARSAQ